MSQQEPGILDNEVLDQWEIPFGDWIEQSIDWIDNELEPVLQVIEWPFDFLIDTLVANFLEDIPWLAVVAGMALIAFLARGVQVAAFTTVALTVCGLLGTAYWLETARTIGYIGVAVFLCVLIGIPVGVLSGRIDGVWQVVRPVLDAMQVVHSFVYMLPFIFFWGTGPVSATMVTMIFALPPLIRLTNLGVRQVPEDVVEAARAYGSSERRVLTEVQLPLARPAIMTGINQTLLLAISMLGIAAIMGAGGLGRLLFRALSNQDPALAASAGLAFFLVAVTLDRITQREDDSRGFFEKLRAAWAHRRDPEAQLPSDSTEGASAWEYQPAGAAERLPIGLAALGGVLLAVSVALPWTADAGRFSAFGRRADEDLAGQTFNGLQASGGSWFGYIALASGLFVVAAAAVGWFRPGTAGRWLGAAGATVASLLALVMMGAYQLAEGAPNATPVGWELGIVAAVVGSVLAAAGAILWLRVAPQETLKPVAVNVSRGRVFGALAAIGVLLGAMFAGWSFDERRDVVITPELQAEIDALLEEAGDDPTRQGVIASQITSLTSSAARTEIIVTDGLTGDGARLGLWSLVLGGLGAIAGLLSAGVGGLGERTRWFWGAISVGIGAGVMAISAGWIGTLARAADPNYVSGVGSFLALCGGFILLASSVGILGDFGRRRLYDDGDAPDGSGAPEVVEDPTPVEDRPLATVG